MLNLKALNDNQRDAVTFESGNLLVLAGPGSGKTFTIVQRIYYLIEKLKVLPEKILVISFTRDSALEMQNRFLKESHFFYPVVFGTFHSVFYHIIQDNNRKSFNIISQTKKKQIIKRILTDLFLSFQGTDKPDFFEYNSLCESFLNAISYFKNTLDYDKSKLRIEDKYSEYFQEILNKYEKLRKADNSIDFDDMVFDCLDLLEHNKQIFQKWNGRFSYILIDEFQDINPIQYKIVRLLMGPDTKLFVVGDDDQSIYSFRGSSPECMKKVIKECRCSIVNLKINYRNTEQIRELSERIISESISRIPKVSISNNPGSEMEHLFVYGYENKEKHYEAIVEKIRELGKEEISVLFRTNLEMQRFAIMLDKAGIKYTCKEKRQSIYEHFIVKDIMAYLFIANFPNDIQNGERYASIINKPSRYINREALLGEDETIENVLKYYHKQSDEKFSKKIIYNVNILKKDLSFIKERPIYAAINYVLKKIGYEKYILECALHDKFRKEEYLSIIEWFLEDSKKYDNLKDYINAQKEYNNRINADMDDSYSDEKSCNVNLMTVHASKGLEFKNVIIAECNEGNFPHGKLPDEETVNEERRLFYVAVTRSSENVFLYYIKGTKERIAIPSRFINNLLDKCVTKQK